jgi:hypothetical protein
MMKGGRNMLFFWLRYEFIFEECNYNTYELFDGSPKVYWYSGIHTHFTYHDYHIYKSYISIKNLFGKNCKLVDSL